MPIPKQFVCSLPFVLEESDLLPSGQRNPRQLLRTHTRPLGEVPDVLVKLINTQFVGELLEQQQENDVVCKNDNLPAPRFLY